MPLLPKCCSIQISKFSHSLWYWTNRIFSLKNLVDLYLKIRHKFPFRHQVSTNISSPPPKTYSTVKTQDDHCFFPAESQTIFGIPPFFQNFQWFQVEYYFPQRISSAVTFNSRKSQTKFPSIDFNWDMLPANLRKIFLSNFYHSKIIFNFLNTTYKNFKFLLFKDFE